MPKQASKAKPAVPKELQRTSADLEALRIEARRPIECGSTYTQCQSGYKSQALRATAGK
jgi:hypothetical protein